MTVLGETSDFRIPYSVNKAKRFFELIHICHANYQCHYKTSEATVGFWKDPYRGRSLDFESATASIGVRNQAWIILSVRHVASLQTATRPPLLGAKFKARKLWITLTGDEYATLSGIVSFMRQQIQVCSKLALINTLDFSFLLLYQRTTQGINHDISDYMRLPTNHALMQILQITTRANMGRSVTHLSYKCTEWQTKLEYAD